jgi:hypothetical protein
MKVTAYRLNDFAGDIDQIQMKRDWMDLTFDRHAYHCFPMSLANRLGWGISFPEDITFIWDGINDSTPNHVRILSGEKYVHADRGNRTISFNTGIHFHTDKNLSLLTMPVPNQFIPGAQCITTVISTSVLETDFPIAWMITIPNIEITIPAGTPIASILPISLKDIQSYDVVVKNEVPTLWQTNEWADRMSGRSEASMARNSVGDWTHFYRDAVDHTGQSVGEHESKKLVMKVINEQKG